VQGQKLMHAMLPMFYLLENGGKYIQYVKYGCELAGIPVGSPRQPLLPLSDTEKADFRRLYEQLKSAKLGKLAA
jgi:4-hydroxy-tetrahydrodipicolinate synthase